jgi:prophage regulatory protein
MPHIKETLLRVKSVQDLTGLGKSSLYASMRDGLFPNPVKIGKRAVAWKASDVDLNCCQFRSNTKESFSIVNHCSNMG